MNAIDAGLSIENSPLWPSGDDALILRAVMREGDDALAAWRSWRDRVDYGTLDFAQRRLVPLLYAKLRALEVSDPMLAHYRNDTRIFWVKNQELFRFASEEVDRLVRAGMEALVLKGLPLAVLYYESTGLRPMSDIDILVRPEAAVGAIGYFLARGWSCSDKFIVSLDHPEQIVAVRNGINMREPVSGKEIDLHWRLLKSGLADFDPFWEASRGFEVGGRSLRTLCATDLLFHACAQAADWNVVRPIRWIPDATMIIARDTIDWDRLVDQAVRTDAVDTIRDALCVLRKFAGVAVPEETLERMRSLPSSLLAQLDYRTASRAPLALVGRPMLRYLRYRRIGKPQGLRFDQYLRYTWGVSSMARAFRYGVRLIWRDLLGKGYQDK